MTQPTPMILQPWGVYWVPNVLHMTPPKPKFVVVIDATAVGFRGFVINSDYPPFVKAKPALKANYALITVLDHTFLRYDSFVDCLQIYPFGSLEIGTARYVGRVTTNCAQGIQTAAANSPRIKPKTQNIIAGMPLP